jgi:hypothetical protein
MDLSSDDPDFSAKNMPVCHEKNISGNTIIKKQL